MQRIADVVDNPRLPRQCLAYRALFSEAGAARGHRSQLPRGTMVDHVQRMNGGAVLFGLLFAVTNYNLLRLQSKPEGGGYGV